MKTILTSLFLLVGVSVNAQVNQVNTLQIRRIWEDGREYPTYTAFYLFPGQPYPKCVDFNVAKYKKEYEENMKWIKEKYPNAKFRQVAIRYKPTNHEVELTFEKFKEVICSQASEEWVK